uniref:phospholipase A2 n=1 Tax=Micrurus fulvius TaxID=8637 RepID=U3FAA2_MICFL
MNPAHLLVLAAVCVSLLGASSIPPEPLNLINFKRMIECTTRRSVWDFTNYGCYCGSGGRGTPVDELDRCCKVHDELDRCCQVHDKCYDTAKRVHKCFPSVRTYSYDCSEGKLTCKDNNTKCKDFVCNCDRTAALCFAKTPYNDKNYNIDLKHCQ